MDLLPGLVIENPKRGSSAGVCRENWFQYYAGFSGGFARELIRSSGLPRRSTVMDPWNGSGTSTAAAALEGHRALGFDINPAMVVVAKAPSFRAQRRQASFPCLKKSWRKRSLTHAKVRGEVIPSSLGSRRGLRLLFAQLIPPFELYWYPRTRELSPLTMRRGCRR